MKRTPSRAPRTPSQRSQARRRAGRLPFRPLLERLEQRLAPANVDVLNNHADIPAVANYPNGIFLTGQNLQEQTLTPTNVSSTSFGTLFSSTIDGQAYAQPLYKANLMINGTPHNVAFVATEHDSVYAFDADTGTQLWHDTFIDTTHGIIPVPYRDIDPSNTPDLYPEIGITGSPVIDGTTSTLYVVAKTEENRTDGQHFVQKLHALDLATGAEQLSGPYQIGDSMRGGPDGGWTDNTAIYVNGTGGGANSNGQVYFNANRENQRMSLELIGNVVYVAWASHADVRPYHGWIIGFDKTTLQPVKVFNTAPNADGVAIWESGGGLSFDGTYLYFAVGNGFGAGAYDPPHGNYSESVIKLDPTPNWTPTNPQMMRVADYFTPYNWQSLDTSDADLGSGGVMLLPDSVGSTAHRHLLVETGKQGVIYLIDRDNLGQNVPPPGPDNVVQTVTAGQTGVWGNPSFAQISPTSGIIYYHGTNSVLKGYMISNGHIDTSNILQSSISSHFPGTQPSVSADGTTDPLNPVNGIVWELQVDNAEGRIQGVGDNLTGAGPATLRAFRTTSLSTELYDSNQRGQRDFFGGSVKFTVAVVTNGHVLAAGADHFSVLGLFPTETAAPAAPSNLTGMLQSTTQGPQIQLNWTNPAPSPGMDPTGIDIFRSTDGVTFTPYNTVNRNLTTFTDTGPFIYGQRYYYEVRAANQVGVSGFSNVVNVIVPIPPAVLTVTGTGTSAISLSWTPVTNDHYVVERSSNGTTFTAVATLPAFVTSYTDTGLTPGLYTYRIHAFSADVDSFSNVQGTWVGPTIDHSAGFSNGTDLTTNGSAVIASNLLRLTDSANQAGSAFSNTRFAVENFTTSFQARLHEGTQPNYANGFVFVLQASSPSAVGLAGQGIGYQGILHSVAIKFDTYSLGSENGTGGSTGLFFNGDMPTVPQQPGEVNLPLDATMVNLESQSLKTITLTYTYNPSNPDASVLHETILDPDHGTMPEFTYDYMVNIPQRLGSETAYVGLTGATGSGSFFELEDILTWHFTSQAPLPGAPTSLRQTSFTSSAVDLAWNSNSYNETGYQVERSTNGTTFTVVGTTTVPTFEDIGLPSATYFYRVKALNGTGSSPDSNTLQVNLPGAILTQHQDIGTATDPALPGNATFTNGTYTLTASGSDIWTTADHMQYLYRPFSGDGQIIARVATEQSGVNDFAKAGVMFRSDLTAGAPNAFMLEFPYPGSRGYPVFQYRPTAGASTIDNNESGRVATPAPIWLRVDRTGNLFSGYYALDNNGMPGTWVLMESETIFMSPSVYVGLALTSHNNNAIITATFDHVQIIPTVLQTSHLDVTPSAFFVNPGQPVNITIRALDQYNNVVTGYRGTVHFTTSDPTVTLPPDYTYTAADNGVHTFTFMPTTLGRQTFTATDTSTGLIAGSTAVTVTNAPVLSSLLVAGFPSPVIAGTAGRFTVTARDTMGNTLTGYTGTVHFTSSDPQARLPMDYTFTAADMGVHTFTATLNTVGMQSITVTDPTFGVNGSQTGIVVQAQPTITSISRSSAVVAQGAAFVVSGTFTDPAPGQTHQVVVSWGDTTTNTTLSLAAGVFTFSTSHAYALAGNFEVHVTLTAAGASDAVILSATAAAVPPPSGLVDWWTGDGSNPITAPDLAGTNAGTLNGGVTYAPGEVGNAFSFNGSDTRTNYVNIPDAPSLNSTTGTWGFWVKTTQTGSYVGFVGKADAGSSLNGIVMQMDPNGLPRLEIKNNTQTTLLTGTTHLNDGQWHYFVLTFQSAGPAIMYVDGQQQATATAVAFTFHPNPLRFGTQLDTFWVPYNGLLDEVQIFSRVLSATEIQTIYSAGSAGEIKGVRVLGTHLVVGGFPSPTTAGASGTFTVTAQDAFGNTVQGYRGTVHFTSSDPQAIVPNDYTFTAADNGTHTFTATLKTAGSQSITATDTAEASTTGTQAGIVVNPAATSTLVVSGFPSPTTAGALGAGVVTAEDAFGNVTPGYRGTVHLMSSDRQAQLGGDHTFTATDNGRYSFAGILYTAGTQSITATDTANAMITGSQTGITVNPAAAAALSVSGFPSPVVSGTPGTFTVTVHDAYGNLATNYTGTVHFNTSDPQAVLPADYQFTAADQGTHTFPATLVTVGTQSITATDTANVSLTSTENVTVLPAGFVVAGFPSPTRAGAVGTFTVTAVDANGHAAVNYAGTVAFRSSDPQAQLPDDYPFTAADQGTHTFAAILYTAGTQSLTATDTANATITGSQTGIVVMPAAALGGFVVQGFPSPVQAGTPGTFTVTALDIYGNVLPTYTGTVTFSSSDPQAQLPDNYTFTSDDQGTHMFTATLKTAGPQSLIATDVATGLSGEQDGIQVTPSVGVSFQIAYPSPVPAGMIEFFPVTAVDAYGNPNALYTGRVTFSSSDAAANLPNDYTFTTADNGSHMFAAAFNTPGIQSLTVTDINDSSITGTQDNIEVQGASGPDAGVRGAPATAPTISPGAVRPASPVALVGSGSLLASSPATGAAPVQTNGPDGSSGAPSSANGAGAAGTTGVEASQVTDQVFSSWGALGDDPEAARAEAIGQV